jgi:hypothetical protein
MNTIGSQVSIQACMSSHRDSLVPPCTGRPASNRKTSVPSAREIVREAVSTFQPSGTAAPGSRRTARNSSFASSQVVCAVSSTVSL